MRHSYFLFRNWMSCSFLPSSSSKATLARSSKRPKQARIFRNVGLDRPVLSCSISWVMPRRFIARVKFSPKMLNTFLCFGKTTAVRFAVDLMIFIVTLYFHFPVDKEVIVSLSVFASHSMCCNTPSTPWAFGAGC